MRAETFLYPQKYAPWLYRQFFFFFLANSSIFHALQAYFNQLISLFLWSKNPIFTNQQAYFYGRLGAFFVDFGFQIPPFCAFAYL